MARPAKATVSRRAIPGDIINVSRMEHETLTAEVLANRRRLDRDELQLATLEREVTDLKKIVLALQNGRGTIGR